MSIYTDIELLVSLVRRHTAEEELATRVEDWLESPSCPLDDTPDEVDDDYLYEQWRDEKNEPNEENKR